eukprot:181788-Hanusia_phi.AAC.1
MKLRSVGLLRRKGAQKVAIEHLVNDVALHGEEALLQATIHPVERCKELPGLVKHRLQVRLGAGEQLRRARRVAHRVHGRHRHPVRCPPRPDVVRQLALRCDRPVEALRELVRHRRVWVGGGASEHLAGVDVGKVRRGRVERRDLVLEMVCAAHVLEGKPALQAGVIPSPQPQVHRDEVREVRERGLLLVAHQVCCTGVPDLVDEVRAAAGEHGPGVDVLPGQEWQSWQVLAARTRRCPHTTEVFVHLPSTRVAQLLVCVRIEDKVRLPCSVKQLHASHAPQGAVRYPLSPPRGDNAMCAVATGAS